MSDRDDEGVTATVNQTGGAGGPGRNGHGRGSLDHERQGRSAYLVGVLARALSTQVEELARATPVAPDGWWFAEPARPDGTADADEREEQR